jgi:hypothetical protein
MKPRRNEEAQAHIGLSSHKKKRNVEVYESVAGRVRRGGGVLLQKDKMRIRSQKLKYLKSEFFFSGPRRRKG